MRKLLLLYNAMLELNTPLLCRQEGSRMCQQQGYT